MTLSEIIDLLTKADSLCSLIYYREASGLSDQTKKELNVLCTELRVATNTLGSSRYTDV